MACELLVIVDAAATGRADCVPGEVCCVKPLGWKWSDRERAEFAVVVVPDMTVEEAQAVYCADGVPDAVKQAETAETLRFSADCDAARAAAAPSIEAAKVAAETLAAKNIDDGFPVADVLTTVEKEVLTPERKKALTVERIGRAAEAKAAADAILDVTPPDPTTRIPPSRYPTRLRHLDLAALDVNPKTAKELEGLTITKDVG